MDMPGMPMEGAQDPQSKMMECVAKIEAALAVLKQELGAEEQGEPKDDRMSVEQAFGKGFQGDRVDGPTY